MCGFFRLVSLYTDRVAGLYLKRGDVDFASVYQNMTVINELPCLPAGGEKPADRLSYRDAAQAENKQVLTGNSLHPCGPLEIIAEIALQG